MLLVEHVDGVDNLDASRTRPRDHVRSPASTRERDYEVGLLPLQHQRVADGSCCPTVRLPVGMVGDALVSVLPRPAGRQRVSASGSAVDDAEVTVERV